MATVVREVVSKRQPQVNVPLTTRDKNNVVPIMLSLLEEFHCMYTVPSRKRAHGWCTLHWAKIGGWADILSISIAFMRERVPR